MDDFRLQYLLESCRTRLRQIQRLKAQARVTTEPNGYFRICLNPSPTHIDSLKCLDQMIRSFAYLVNQVVLTSIGIERQLHGRDTTTGPPAFLTRPLRHTRSTIATSIILPSRDYLHKLQIIAQLLMAERYDVSEPAVPATSENAFTLDQQPILTIDDTRFNQPEPQPQSKMVDTSGDHSILSANIMST
ncbi:hypothetical protein H4R35_007159, partial [Dimargaris xerosporica]